MCGLVGEHSSCQLTLANWDNSVNIFQVAHQQHSLWHPSPSLFSSLKWASWEPESSVVSYWKLWGPRASAVATNCCRNLSGPAWTLADPLNPPLNVTQQVMWSLLCITAWPPLGDTKLCSGIHGVMDLVNEFPVLSMDVIFRLSFGIWIQQLILGW